MWGYALLPLRKDGASAHTFLVQRTRLVTSSEMCPYRDSVLLVFIDKDCFFPPQSQIGRSVRAAYTGWDRSTCAQPRLLVIRIAKRLPPTMRETPIVSND